MARRWHVEHRDGREWTREELRRMNVPFMTWRDSPFDVCVTEAGTLVLLDYHGHYCYAVEATDDMEVVWDG